MVLESYESSLGPVLAFWRTANMARLNNLSASKSTDPAADNPSSQRRPSSLDICWDNVPGPWPKRLKVQPSRPSLSDRRDNSLIHVVQQATETAAFAARAAMPATNVTVVTIK